MTGPVDRTGAAASIAALIRQAVSESQSRRQSGRATQSRDTAKAKGGASAHKPIESIIARRAQELSPDAPDFESRMLRLVVEASLLHEFGQHLINAPKFQSMVDQVLHEIETSPQLHGDIATVIGDLTGTRTVPKR